MAADPILYAAVNRRTQISAPNFVRSRARYRGHRESFKINLEIHQLAYDLRRLYERYDVIDAALTTHLNTIEDGGQVGATLVGTVGVAVRLAGDTSDKPFIITGVDDIADRLSRLETRIKNLEMGA